MNRRLIVIVCGTALLLTAVPVLAQRDRCRPLPPPDVPVVTSPAEVRVKAVERSRVATAAPDASRAVAVIYGKDSAAADRYEARNDALGSTARRRDLPKDDVGSSRLTVPPEGVSFGEIPAGGAAEKEIVLRNDSTSPVLVTGVKPCCGADAALSTMRIEPSSAAVLKVSLKPAIPGGFSKHVRILCDDPEMPVVVIPVTGAAVETPSAGTAYHWTFLTVLLAGLADGFNPCAFSIIIVLAGILAVGGRKRRARLLGGWAFCIASFLTYMAMGIGLVRVLRALEGLGVFHDIAMTMLSIALFVLGFLSVRDAYRYRKAKVPSAITLQLPGKVKRLIRVVAETSWSGPAVVVTGFGCGFLVTLLDSLCTGQIYVPVLALISREAEAWRSFMLLAVYNLAFTAPLITIFILAARGADSERMSRWSRRNVFPSKIAMGFVFVILGALVMPRCTEIFMQNQ